MNEMHRMKDSYEKSNEEYIKRAKQEHSKMLDTIDNLRKIIDKQEGQLNLTSSRTMSNSNQIKEL